MITSSLDAAQAPLLMVHLKVAAPVTNPVTPDVGLVGVVTVAVPATTVHAPVPVAGVLPAKVAVLTLHRFWSGPALLVLGKASISMVTSSVDTAQAPLLMVHLKVALAPTTIPVTVEVGLDGVLTVAVPDVTVHVPVPVAGALPARVLLVTLHKF